MVNFSKTRHTWPAIKSTTKVYYYIHQNQMFNPIIKIAITNLCSELQFPFMTSLVVLALATLIKSRCIAWTMTTNIFRTLSFHKNAKSIKFVFRKAVQFIPITRSRVIHGVSRHGDLQKLYKLNRVLSRMLPQHWHIITLLDLLKLYNSPYSIFTVGYSNA